MKSPNRRTADPRTGTSPRASMSRHLLTTGALFCIGIMPLSACSLFNPPLERDESVHAIFDAEQDIVKMPLDDYLYYEGGHSLRIHGLSDCHEAVLRRTRAELHHPGSRL